MKKICGLLILLLTLNLAVFTSAPVFAEAPGPDVSASGIEKTWIRRNCEAGLNRLNDVKDKLVELHLRAALALGKSALLPEGRIYRIGAFIERQYDKLPTTVRELFRPPPWTDEQELRMMRFMLWPSQMSIYGILRLSELFKSRTQRVAHNTRALISNAFPNGPGTEQAPEALEAMMRLLEGKTQGKFTYPILGTTFLFVKNKRFLRRFEIGTRVTVEDGLVVGWSQVDDGTPKREPIPPEYGVVSPMVDHFLFNLLMTGAYPINESFLYPWQLNQPGFEHEYIAFLKRPAGLFEIAVELLTSTPTSRQEFNAYELAKDAAEAQGDDYHDRLRLQKKIADFAAAAAHSNYESSYSTTLAGPMRLFIKGRRWPMKFAAGTKVTLENWYVTEWKK